MAIVENTLDSIYDQLLFISGQNSSSVQIEDAVRLFNYALNEYTYLAITSDGKWKSGDTQVNGLNDFYTTIDGSDHYTFKAEFLMIDRVEYTASDGTVTVLEAVDRRDSKSTSMASAYGTTGSPNYYDNDSDTIKLYPNPSTGTLRVFPSIPFSHFESTTLTQAIGIPSIHVEFLVFHALHRLGLRTNDSNRGQVRAELEIITNKVRDFYSKRDDDTPRKLIGQVNVIE